MPSNPSASATAVLKAFVEVEFLKLPFEYPEYFLR